MYLDNVILSILYYLAVVLIGLFSLITSSTAFPISSGVIHLTTLRLPFKRHLLKHTNFRHNLFAGEYPLQIAQGEITMIHVSNLPLKCRILKQ